MGSKQIAGKEKQINITEVTVQADESTNALVIRAAASEFQVLERVIEQLDLRRAQVFVEAIIAEVSTGQAAELGVEWKGLYTKTSGGKIAGATDFSEQTGGLTLGVVNKLVENAFGILVPDLQVILRALREDRNSNILSTPNLLTLENEPAEIIVGIHDE